MKLIVGIVLLSVVIHGQALTPYMQEFVKETDEQALKKSNLVAVLPKLEKSFLVFFQLKLNSFSNGYRSVIHLTLGEDNTKYGDRIPGVWIYEQKLHVAFAINDNKNEYFFSKPLPLNKWISVFICQESAPFLPTFEVYIDKEQVYYTENRNQKVFTNINVYAGDPWYEVQDGSIKEFAVFNFPRVAKKSLVKDAIHRKMFGLKF